MGGLTPDYRTIARFRDTHKEALKNILKQSVRMCLKLKFLLRGQSSTQAEVGILLTCFNLTRMINLVGALNLKEHLQNFKINPNTN